MKHPIGFNRGVSIEICKDGVVTYRTSITQPRRFGAALTFYSVETEEMAKLLISMVCKLSYNNEYWVHDFKGEVSDIERVAELFFEAEQNYKRKQREE